VDLRQYFKKIRDTESGLADTFPLVVSLETSDGGKAGTISEVTREQAAKLIVENCARLANDAEKQAYFDKQASEKKASDRAEMARRVQVTIVGQPDFQVVEQDHPATPSLASRK
jgi:molybdenum-dependent DNA-binding transcriptional regulator ModE